MEAHEPATGVHEPLDEWLTKLGARSGNPGGGAAAGVMLALGAALLHMTARYTEPDDEIRQITNRTSTAVTECVALIDEDARASEALGAALRAPEGPDRDDAVVDAAQLAAATSRRIAEFGIRVTHDLERLAARAPQSVLADVGVAAEALAAGIASALINLDADILLAHKHGGGMEGAASDAGRLSEARDRVRKLAKSLESRVAGAP